MKLYVIDGNSLFFRAYYATSFTGNIMRRKDGFPTNAIFGFTNMIFKLVSQLKDDDRIIVCFDTGKKTFRSELLEQYKAQRKPIDEDLKVQIPYSRELLKCFGIFTYEQVGYEGDDIAGSVAKQFGSNNKIETHCLTSDKDYLQLIDDYISIDMTKKGLSEIEVMNKTTLKEKMGLTPEQIKDYKGLMGDPSDNLKGIPGIGDKTAVKLIQQYGSLERIIEEMKLQSSKQAQKIVENQELGVLCKKMATIVTDMELPFDIDSLRYEGYDFNALSDFFLKFEFASLAKKLKPSDKRKNSYSITKEEIIVEEVVSYKKIPETEFIIMDQEKGNYHSSQINGFYFLKNKKVYFLSFNNALNDDYFKDYLKDDEKKKITYNFKALKVALAKYGIEVNGLKYDVMLATYLLNSSIKDDEVSIFSYYGKNILQSTNLLEDDSRYKNMAYFLEDVYLEGKNQILENELDKIYYDVEIPVCTILANMEIEGFPVDKKVLESLNEEYILKINELTEKIYEVSGYEFNIASPKQLATLLFEKLGLPTNKKESTSIEVLNELKDKHEVIPLIIEYRKYTKIVSTYSQGLLNYVYDDGKIHALFNQALTQTGRLSSSEPNLQNISVKNEEGKAVRKAFFYNDNNLLLSLDYSQVELRLLATMSKCQKLIDTFNNNEDIHTQTAMDVFSLSKDEVTPELRRRAKAVNFGIIYGISDWGLAEQISSSMIEAKKIITTFYEKYPEVKEYFTNVITKAKEDGYVKTLYNRKRYIPELSSDNYQIREFGKRAAMNAPIQGTAADLIKICMVKVDKMLKDNHYKTKMVLQIHDELIFKVPEEEKDYVPSKIKEVMENCVDLGIKFEVDGAISKTWYDCK